MVKMAASLLQSGEDAFKKIFKYYKRRNPPPDVSDVIDFSKRSSSDKVVPVKLDHAAVTDMDAVKVGLKPIREWSVYSLIGFPGFMFICNPFQRGAQSLWVRQTLKTYPQKPNICNLDLHMDPQDTRDIWTQSVPQQRAPPAGTRESKTLLERLRWVTVGYHYNWDTKTYSADHHTPFPAELHLLAAHVAAACGFPGFNAEAGILNYYRSDSSLGIHVDESELDHSRPLLSFSFGQSSIFLLGGLQRQDPPTAMYMHSGDVMVMSGQSRLLYHAVPRIVVTAPGQLTTESGLGPHPLQHTSVLEPMSEEDWSMCFRYLSNSRINVTVRQVLGPGQTLPETAHSDQHHNSPLDGSSTNKKIRTQP